MSTITAHCRKCGASTTGTIANAIAWDTLHAAQCENATTAYVIAQDPERLREGE